MLNFTSTSVTAKSRAHRVGMTFILINPTRFSTGVVGWLLATMSRHEEKQNFATYSDLAAVHNERLWIRASSGQTRKI